MVGYALNLRGEAKAWLTKKQTKLLKLQKKETVPSFLCLLIPCAKVVVIGVTSSESFSVSSICHYYTSNKIAFSVLTLLVG